MKCPVCLAMGSYGPVGPFRGLTIHMVRRGAHHSDGEDPVGGSTKGRGFQLLYAPGWHTQKSDQTGREGCRKLQTPQTDTVKEPDPAEEGKRNELHQGSIRTEAAPDPNEGGRPRYYTQTLQNSLWLGLTWGSTRARLLHGSEIHWLSCSS